MRINGMKFIFVWTSSRLPTYLARVVQYVKCIAPGLGSARQKVSLAYGTVLEKGFGGFEKQEGVGCCRAGPALLNSLSSSQRQRDGHLPLLGTGHCLAGAGDVVVQGDAWG